jgi:hypothetical protein
LIGHIIAACGWVCLAVGLVLVVGAWVLIPVGAVTTAAGLFLDWEATSDKRR